MCLRCSFASLKSWSSQLQMSSICMSGPTVAPTSYVPSFLVGVTFWECYICLWNPSGVDGMGENKDVCCCFALSDSRICVCVYVNLRNVPVSLFLAASFSVLSSFTSFPHPHVSTHWLSFLKSKQIWEWEAGIYCGRFLKEYISPLSYLLHSKDSPYTQMWQLFCKANLSKCLSGNLLLE